MNFLMVQHRVEDYEKWKVVYDNHEGTRDEYGVKEKYVLRNIEDMNQVTILFEIADISRSKEFIHSKSLQEAMEKAGILGEPEFVFLTG
jgi:hypothetical protein